MPTPTVPRSASLAAVLLASLLVASLLVVGCQDAPPPAEPPPPPAVTVATPLVREIVEWERFTGRLQAVEDVDIQARVSGYLQSAHFDEGQMVQKGDLLVTIDPRPFEIEVSRADASLEQARANLRLAESRLIQAEAERDQAVSAEALAKTRYENAQQAAEGRAIATEQLDARESEYTQARAQTVAAESAITGAKAEIATAEAAILAAGSALDAARLDLEYTQVHAPITGRVGRLEVTKGNLIQGGIGATRLTTIVSTDPIYVFIEASEQELLPYLRRSTLEERLNMDFRHPFFLKLIDEQGYPHSGQIDYADPDVDQNTGTLTVRGILTNPDLTLIPGLFATVQIPAATNGRDEAILIPDAAVMADQNLRLVMTLGDDNTVQPRPVTLGPIVDGLRVVRSGLTVSDRIIISGLQRAFPGAPVTPTPGNIEASIVEDGLPDRADPVPRSEWITLPEDPMPESRLMPTPSTGGRG